MDVLYPRCAGLDVPKDTVVAAVRIAAGGTTKTEVRSKTTLVQCAWAASRKKASSLQAQFQRLRHRAKRLARQIAALGFACVLTPYRRGGFCLAVGRDMWSAA